MCYADDVILIAENKNYLQILVYNFDKARRKYNMKIAEGKTKSITISRDVYKRQHSTF